MKMSVKILNSLRGNILLLKYTIYEIFNNLQGNIIILYYSCLHILYLYIILVQESVLSDFV